MKKFDNFSTSLNNLKDIYDYSEPYENVVLTGLVALFEICFEQSWKALKEVLEDQGFQERQTGSPRLVLKTAHQAGIIKDETHWLAALSQRNNAAHAYNKNIALSIVADTKERFYQMFCDLHEELERNWLH